MHAFLLFFLFFNHRLEVVRIWLEKCDVTYLNADSQSETGTPHLKSRGHL